MYNEICVLDPYIMLAAVCTIFWLTYIKLRVRVQLWEALNHM